MTLYRAGDRSPVVDALVRAARRARRWRCSWSSRPASTRRATSAGSSSSSARARRSSTGWSDSRTTRRSALVVRREDGAIRRYAHIGTGNYNAGTARVYTDLGLFTADPAHGRRSRRPLQPAHRAPRGRPRPRSGGCWWRRSTCCPALLERIARESGMHARGPAGRDPRQAQRARRSRGDPGPVRRVARRASRSTSWCADSARFVPACPGSRSGSGCASLIGRFLEHARIYHFGDGGDDEYLIGSADWRSRNLRRRVEVAAPVRDAACRRRLDRILTRELADPRPGSWTPDGRYRQLRSASRGRPRHRTGRGDLGSGSRRKRRRHGPAESDACVALLLRCMAGSRRSPPGAVERRRPDTRRRRPGATTGPAACTVPLRRALPGSVDHADPGRGARSPSASPAGSARRSAAEASRRSRSGSRAPTDAEYQFRSLDKDPSPLLPPELRHTLAQRILQDQISAGPSGRAAGREPAARRRRRAPLGAAAGAACPTTPRWASSARSSAACSARIEERPRRRLRATPASPAPRRS